MTPVRIAMKIIGTIIKIIFKIIFIIFKIIGIILFVFVAAILGMMALRAATAIVERRNTPGN
jgi:hypothetical protein